MEPNKTNIAKWAAALRSGKYLQGRERLCGDEGGQLAYCCLGVTCDVAREYNIPCLRWEFETGSSGNSACAVWRGAGCSQSWSSLSPEVMEWLGFVDADPLIADELRAAANEFWTFAEIAAALEARYLGSC